MTYLIIHKDNLSSFWLTLYWLSVSCSVDWNHPLHGKQMELTLLRADLVELISRNHTGVGGRVTREELPLSLFYQGSHFTSFTLIIVRFVSVFILLQCIKCNDAFQESWMEKEIGDVLNIMENHGTGPLCFRFYFPIKLLNSKWNRK